eukprot:scaffold139620_cov148-Phaeocystis_antarctica.AAC.2
MIKYALGPDWSSMSLIIAVARSTGVQSVGAENCTGGFDGLPMLLLADVQHLRQRESFQRVSVCRLCVPPGPGWCQYASTWAIPLNRCDMGSRTTAKRCGSASIRSRSASDRSCSKQLPLTLNEESQSVVLARRRMSSLCIDLRMAW